MLDYNPFSDGFSDAELLIYIITCTITAANKSCSTPNTKMSPFCRNTDTLEPLWTDSPVNEGEDIKHGGHIWVVMSRGLLQVLQSLLAEGHSHLVPALGGVLDHQVVEGPQTGRNLIASLLGSSHRGAAVAGLDWTRRNRRKVRREDAQLSDTVT